MREDAADKSVPLPVMALCGVSPHCHASIAFMKQQLRMSTVEAEKSDIINCHIIVNPVSTVLIYISSI